MTDNIKRKDADLLDRLIREHAEATDEVERLRKERDEARRIIVECINQGTDGKASAECSMWFLSHAPTECAAIKRQRDEARRDTLEEIVELLVRSRAATIPEAIKHIRSLKDRTP